MGNQLVGIAPSQIYPVEHYFAGTIDHDLQFDLRWVDFVNLSYIL